MGAADSKKPVSVPLRVCIVTAGQTHPVFSSDCARYCANLFFYVYSTDGFYRKNPTSPAIPPSANPTDSPDYFRFAQVWNDSHPTDLDGNFLLLLSIIIRFTGDCNWFPSKLLHRAAAHSQGSFAAHSGIRQGG